MLLLDFKLSSCVSLHFQLFMLSLDVQFLLLFKYTAVLINLLTASIFQGCLWLKHDRTFEILTLFQFY